MKAPKLPSLFRNVKNDHRKFTFRSPYVDKRKQAIEERLNEIEREVAAERGEQTDFPPKKISFGGRRRTRRRKSNLMATLRVILILVILVYLMYKGIQWAEQTDFGKVMKILQDG
jgi:hypothetical protein